MESRATETLLNVSEPATQDAAVKNCSRSDSLCTHTVAYTVYNFLISLHIVQTL